MFERRIWSRTPGHGVGVEPLVRLDRLGLDPDALAVPRHPQRAAPAAADEAAAAATSSAIARHSSPSGKRYRASDDGQDLRAVPRLRRHHVARVTDHHRVDEMLVEVVDILDHPALERAGNADVVDDREVLHELAQPDAAGVGADRHAELRRHQQDRQHLVHAAEPACVDLADTRSPRPGAAA